MRVFQLFIALLCTLFISNVFSADHKLRLGTDVIYETHFEYEFSIIPFLGGYVNYGSGDRKIDKYNTSTNGYKVGTRFYIPLIGYLGVGYQHINFDYSYIASQASGSISQNDTVTIGGALSGLVFEAGKEWGVGPVILGANANYLLVSPSSLSAKANNVSVDSDDVTEGIVDQTSLWNVAAYIGIQF
jgi:hypothetical protein